MASRLFLAPVNDWMGLVRNSARSQHAWHGAVRFGSVPPLRESKAKHMRDLKRYLDELHADSKHCLAISKSTLNGKLASDIEAVMATNAILDEERGKRLIGLLSTLLRQSPKEPKPPEK